MTLSSWIEYADVSSIKGCVFTDPPFDSATEANRTNNGRRTVLVPPIFAPVASVGGVPRTIRAFLASFGRAGVACLAL